MHWRTNRAALKYGFKTNLLFLTCNNKRNFELLKTPLVLKALEETQLCYFEPEILSSKFFPKETIVPVPQFPDKGCVFSGTSLLCSVGGWGVLRGLVVWHVPFLFSFLPRMSLFSEILPVSIPGLDLSQGVIIVYFHGAHPSGPDFAFLKGRGYVLFIVYGTPSTTLTFNKYQLSKWPDKR